MKKLLLTLLLLLSLGFAASAQGSADLATFNGGKTSTSFSTYSSTDGWTVKNANVNNAKVSVIYPVLNGKKTTIGTLTSPALSGGVGTVSIKCVYPHSESKGMNFTLNIKQNNAVVKTQTFTDASNDKAEFISEAFNLTGDFVIEIVAGSPSNSTSNKDRLGIYELTWTGYTGGSEKITLEESNLVIKAGEQVIEGEEVELDANTTLTFSYNTDNANADITYSYSTDATNYTEGNSYTFDGNDVTLLVKATSENEVGKMLTVTKKYPTECPTPVFSVANGAEVYAGQVITVKADGAESLHLTANDVDVDGTSYTVVGNPGDEITLYALASVMGKNGEITADATITVKVIEATEATFNFIAKTYGLKVISDNNDGYEDSVSEITEGIANMSFTGNYRLWKTTDNNQLRVMSGATFTISVPDGYYIESIDFDGSVSKATSNVGSIISKVWSYSGKVSAVKFTCSGRVDINTVTVKYAKLVPTLALSRVEITHGKVAGVVTIDYTFEIANHNGNEVEVTATIDGMDVVFEKVPAPAAAPARAAGENAIFSGILKAKHDDLKGEQPLSINVKATLDGNDLYNETHTNFQTTGIEDVTVEGGEAAEYFNLQGIRVAEPQAGQVYIVRRGAKTTKELVK